MRLDPLLRKQLAEHELVERHARLSAACCDVNGPGINVAEHVRCVEHSIEHPLTGRRLLPPGYHNQRVREHLAARM